MKIQFIKEFGRTDDGIDYNVKTYHINIKTNKVDFKIGVIPTIIYQYKKLRKLFPIMKSLVRTLYWFCDPEITGFYHYRILCFAMGWKQINYIESKLGEQNEKGINLLNKY